MPVENRSRLTSGFGWQAWRQYTHTGLDFGGVTPGKSSPVLAAADGVVDLAGGSIPLRTGPQIKINHPDGSATTYGHTRYMKVRRGQTVRRGDQIADTWHTGLAASAGIHLHFERWTNANDHTTRHDPTAWLAANGWVIRDGRLYDDWEGRTDGATITPASTTPEEFTVSQINEIAAKVAQAVADISIPVTRSGKSVTRTLATLVSSIDSQGIHNTGRISELEGIVEKLAEKTGLTAAEVEAAATRGAETGAEKAIADGVDFGTATITFGKD